LVSAIKASDAKQVSFLLTDPGLVSSGSQADANFTFSFNGFTLTPLLLAIQCVGVDQADYAILESLMQAYADLNHAEATTGFTPIIMACHINTEEESLAVVERLVSHRFYVDQPRIVNVDAQDSSGCSALHYAAATGKAKLCKYLVEELQVSTELSNNAGL